MRFLRDVLSATADTAWPAFMFAWAFVLVLPPVVTGSGWSFLTSAEFQKGTVALAAAVPFIGIGLAVVRARKRKTGELMER